MTSHRRSQQAARSMSPGGLPIVAIPGGASLPALREHVPVQSSLPNRSKQVHAEPEGACKAAYHPSRPSRVMEPAKRPAAVTAKNRHSAIPEATCRRRAVWSENHAAPLTVSPGCGDGTQAVPE